LILDLGEKIRRGKEREELLRKSPSVRPDKGRKKAASYAEEKGKNSERKAKGELSIHRSERGCY